MHGEIGKKAARVWAVLVLVLGLSRAFEYLKFSVSNPMFHQRSLKSSVLLFSRNRNHGTSASSKIIEGIESLIEKYDGFILDQFGVLHDGSKALPGAVECVSRLQAAGKKLVILSNSSKNSAYTIKRLPKYGFKESAFVGAVTSGDEALKYIHSANRWNQKCMLFTWEGWQDIDQDFFNQLQLEFKDAEEADFILAHGTDLIVTGEDSSIRTELKSSGCMEAYMPYLEKALERGIPMVVANPDFLVNFPDGTQGYMPGNISKKYQEMGGTVFEYGKPHKAHFEACIDLLELDKEKIIHVGDSLHHDIQGAFNAGIDSLLIGAGIHAPELELNAYSTDNLRVEVELFEKLCKENCIKPTWVTSLFKL
mmetsp:Transcript_32533/g.41704  ORF Transcript_32533/g.41704 Transcript_32533/m.41704 type:complete len:366 (+) Transcript_32533:31-1128(+)